MAKHQRFLLTLIILLISGLPVRPEIAFSQSSTPKQTEGKIAYVFSYDKAVACSFKDFLEAKGWSVQLIQKKYLDKSNLNDFNCIIIGPEIGFKKRGLDYEIFHAVEPDPFSQKELRAITDTRVPIIGLGEGGYYFFGVLSLNIGMHAATGGKENYIHPLNIAHPVWNTPFKIRPNSEGKVILYSSDQPGVGIHNKYISSSDKTLGSGGYDFVFNSLIIEKNFYILWGSAGHPGLMTDEGRRLFQNVIHFSVTLKKSQKP